MPKRTNKTRLQHMTTEELAQELTRISKSEVIKCADFEQWLSGTDPQLLPHGRRVIAEILIKERHTGALCDIEEVECIVLSDNERFFGIRHVQFFDIAADKIKSVPFDCFTIRRWPADGIE